MKNGRICRVGCDYLLGTFGAANQRDAWKLLLWPSLVVGVRILKVTGTGEPELEGGCFVAGLGESPFQLEDGLLGSVIKMLTNV